MKIPKRFGLKIYVFVFAWLALGGLTALTSPESDAYMYYHVAMAFHKQSQWLYIGALISAGTTLLCVIPVFLQAFCIERFPRWPFKLLLFVRIMADIIGHNYEWQFIKSILINQQVPGIALIILIIVMIYPSYYGHMAYAFKKKTSATT